MSDIQTEMIMNSDSSNIVSDILKELNLSSNKDSTPPNQPQEMPRPNNILNENAVINQYNNTDISNEIQLNRQMDPNINLSSDIQLDVRN